MNLHAYNTLTASLPSQCWRGLRAIMQLHEKRHKKRAGEAGIALRASDVEPSKMATSISSWLFIARIGFDIVTP